MSTGGHLVNKEEYRDNVLLIGLTHWTSSGGWRRRGREIIKKQAECDRREKKRILLILSSYLHTFTF